MSLTAIEQLNANLADNKAKMDTIIAQNAERATKTDSEIKSAKDEIKSLQDENAHIKAELGTETEARRAIELRFNREGMPGSGGQGAPEIKSWGQTFAESENWKQFASANGTQFKTDAVPIGNIHEVKSTMGNIALPSPTNLLYRPQDLGFLAPLLPKLIMRDMLKVSTTTQNAIEFQREDVFTNGAAVVPESGLKPQAQITFTEDNATIKTIAQWMPFTNQFMADFPRLISYINTRLITGLRQKEEYEFLYGTNSQTSLCGIKHTAGVQTYKWSDGDVIDGMPDTMMDAILMALLKCTNSLFIPDGVVMNPNDMGKIKKAKSTTGEYLFPSLTTGAAPQLWGMNVVESLSINEGEFLVGAFAMGGEIFDRQAASVRITDGYMDYVVHNKSLILVEERLNLVLYRPSAFVWGSFDHAPATGS